MMPSPHSPLTATQRSELLNTLGQRFAQYPHRHPELEWATVLARLAAAPEALWSLNEMERTGGEPDVVGQDPTSGAFIFFDCATESPKGRRSLCYDPAALAARKDAPPANSALGLAATMGIAVMNEMEYRQLQTLGPCDTKTSSWLLTPPEIRQHGGAIFGDFRYGQVFIYHNGAPSYYAARGFRGVLRV